MGQFHAYMRLMRKQVMSISSKAFHQEHTSVRIDLRFDLSLG